MKQAFQSVEEQFNQASLSDQASSSSTGGPLKSSGSASWGILDFDNPLFSDTSMLNKQKATESRSTDAPPPALPPRTDTGSPIKLDLQHSRSDDSGLGVSPLVAKDSGPDSDVVADSVKSQPEKSAVESSAPSDLISSLPQKSPSNTVDRPSILSKHSLAPQASLSTNTSIYSMEDERFVSIDSEMNIGRARSPRASDDNLALFSMNSMPGNFPSSLYTRAGSIVDPSVSSTRSASEPKDEEIVNDVLESSTSKAAAAQLKLSQILEERERQLISASEQNSSLNSSLNTFREQAVELQKQVDVLRREIVAKTDEINQIKASPPQYVTGTNSRFIEELQRALKSKTEQHQALIEEGNQLSISNGKLNVALKKLRLQLEETQESLTESEKKSADVQQQLITARATISELQASEKSLKTQTASLSQSHEELKNTLQQLEKDLNQAKETESTLQTSLDRAWQEIADLKRANATAASEEFQVALDKEHGVNLELKQQIQKFQTDFAEAEQALRKEIFQYKSSVTRLENEINWNEEAHRKEVASYQQKLQAAEVRNDDLSQSIQESTKPLLRQIESLQSHSNSLQDTFKSLESNLTKQLHQVCIVRDNLLNSNREANLKISESERKIIYLNESADRYQAEKISLATTIEEQASQIKKLSGNCQDLEIRLVKSSKEMEERLELVKMQVRESLVADYELKLQDRDQKLKDVDEIIQEKQAEIERIRQKMTRDTDAVSASDRMASPGVALNRAGSITASTILASPALQNYTAEIHQNFRIASLENQLSHMEQQLKAALDAREQVSEDLVNLTVEHNKLKANNQDAVQLQANFEKLQKSMESRNAELLQKNHIISEMREDINDMKQMYRSQIDDLTNRLENFEIQRKAKARQQSLA